MKISKQLIISGIAMGLMVLVLGSLTAYGAPGPAAVRGHECCKTAVVLKEATRNEAYSDFWVNLANALNDPDTAFFDALRDSWIEFHEAMELANDQLDARLDACEELGHGPYHPDLDPADFSINMSNNYLPFVVGRTLVYEKETEDGLETVEVTTLADTVEIDGFICRIINDVESLEGDVVEDTVDWMAQHANGDVWYFGEISKNFEEGLLDNLDGSWMTGKDEAKPGILMLGAPVAGYMYRQEFLVAEAEDLARVISFGETVTVPYGTFTNCLKTEEWSPLEPENVEYKYYAPGIGLVLEVDPEDDNHLELVNIIN